MKNIYIPDRPIAFNRDFVSLGVGITGALFLSQCIYWNKRSDKKDNWFYKTQSEWEDETGLSRREQESARKKLRELGVLEESLAGVPARMYYRINTERLSDLLCVQTSMAESAILESTNTPYSDGGKRHTITESTQRVHIEEKEKNIKEKDSGQEIVFVHGVVEQLKYLGKKKNLKMSDEGIIKLLDYYTVKNIVDVLQKMDIYYSNQSSIVIKDLNQAVRFWLSRSSVSSNQKKVRVKTTRDVSMVSGDLVQYLDTPKQERINTKAVKSLRSKWSRKGKNIKIINS